MKVRDRPRSSTRTAKTKPHAKTKAAARGAVSQYAKDWVDNVVQTLLADCHPSQGDFVRDDAFFITALVGRGGGKTTGGRARFVKRMVEVDHARCLYIADTELHAKRLMWEPLKKLCEQLGIEATFNETELECKFLKNGSTLWLVGADNKKSIEKYRGLPFHEVGIDESASFDVELLEILLDRIILPRLGDYDGTIWMIGTPGHDLRGPFYEATRPSGEQHRPYADRAKPEYEGWQNWSSHAWSLNDPGAQSIPALQRLWVRALLHKANKQWSDRHPVWMREYLGLWAADDTDTVYKFTPYLEADDPRGEAGSTWNIWDPERVGPLQIAKLPAEFRDYLFAFGFDMGAADPFALQVFAASPSDPKRRIWHVYEFESAKNAFMYPKRIAELLFGPDDGVTKPWPNHKRPHGVVGAVGWPVGAISDIAGLGENMLKELNDVYGFKCLGAPRNFNDKYAAIEMFNGDLIDGRLKVLKGSKLAEQLGTLQWKRDEYGKVKEDKAQANHSSDAGVYARPALANIWGEQTTTADGRGAELAAQVAPHRPRAERDDEDVAAPNTNDGFGGSLDDGFDDWGNG